MMLGLNLALTNTVIMGGGASGPPAFFGATGNFKSVVIDGDATVMQYYNLWAGGVTHIRRFFDWKLLYDAANDAARTTIVSGWMTNTIQKDIDAGFRVIVCICPSNSNVDTVSGKHIVQSNEAMFLAYLDYVGDAYSQIKATYSTLQVGCEPYNEPEADDDVEVIVGDDSRDWTDVLAPRLHAAMRTLLPGYVIFIQSANLGWIEDLGRFTNPVMIADPLCVFTYHGYCCTAINHPRTATMRGVAQLPWPVLDANVAATIAAEIANMSARMTEQGYNVADGSVGQAFYNKGVIEITYGYTDFANKAKLKTLAQTAATTLLGRGVPPYRIWNGETGMQGHFNGVGNDDAVIGAWYQSEREIASELGFAGICAYKLFGNEYAINLENASQTWHDTFVQVIAEGLGWTQVDPLSAERMTNGTFDANITGWAATSSGTLSWTLKSCKVAGSNAFKGVNRNAVASGATGKTYRQELLLAAIAGTDPQVAVLARQTASPPTYAQAYPTTPRRVVLEYTASAGAVASQTEANNRTDCIFRIDNVSVKEVVGTL